MPDIDAGLLERGGLRLSVDGQRATITLDRPDVLNAQKPSMWEALQQIGERLDPDVRVVVVRGSGRAFSAGLDTGMFSPDGIDGETGFAEISSLPAAEGEAIIERFQQGFVWLADPSRVTIAAVQGHAIGAGFQLALACDLRIATEDARFTMAEPSLGLVPDLAGTLPLVRAVGYARRGHLRHRPQGARGRGAAHRSGQLGRAERRPRSGHRRTRRRGEQARGRRDARNPGAAGQCRGRRHPR
jgi:enoyl-CoA hydratase/carnithine racemase